MSDDGKTRILKRENLPWGAPASPPPPLPEDESIRKLREEETQRMTGAQPAAKPVSDDRTQLIRPASRAAAPASGGVIDLMENPTVGWLVVIEGPGRGASITVGYGINPIGRDASNRIALPYDDKEISREKHAMIVYDGRGRKFYAQCGASTNLTYLGDEPLLIPREMNSGDTLRLGQTVLKFVAFCGPEFDWEPEAPNSSGATPGQPT